MTGLKVHLLYETLDIAAQRKRCSLEKSYTCLISAQFWKFSDPKDVCALAISSTHGYRIVAYILARYSTVVKEVKTGLNCFAFFFGFCVQIISFSQEHHIRALMTLAGRFCRTVSGLRFPENTFVDCFYEGLELNDGALRLMVMQN